MCGVEVPCFIIGIFEIVSSCLLFLGSICGIGYVTMAMKPANMQLHNMNSYETTADFNFQIAVVCTILGVVVVYAVTSLVFSVLLVIGISKKQPSYMLPYYVYGMIRGVLGLISSIFLIFTIGSAGIVSFIILGIYFGNMHIVRLTYLKYSQQNDLATSPFVKF